MNIAVDEKTAVQDEQENVLEQLMHARKQRRKRNLILLGGALGVAVHPAFWGLSAFVGAGLFVAGATGFCGMARLLTVMPWNRKMRPS